jgi:RNA polymerase sigma-70 factor (ECF subfamily)
VRDKLVEHLPALHRFVYRLCGHPQLAEDLVQDTILRAMRSLDGLKSEETLRVWLFRIARNAWLDDCKKNQRLRQWDDDASETVSLVDADPSETIEHRELIEMANLAITKLPERQRTVLILASGEGLTNGEIAQVLEITTDAVKSNLYAARIAMRNAFKKVDLP